jgi:hypothetical protein
MAHVCVVHLTTLSVAQVIQSQMTEGLMNAHSAMMRKEMVVACSEAIFWHSAEKDCALLSGHSACRRSFKPEISLKQIMGVTWGYYTSCVHRTYPLFLRHRNFRDLDHLLLVNASPYFNGTLTTKWNYVEPSLQFPIRKGVQINDAKPFHQLRNLKKESRKSAY